MNKSLLSFTFMRVNKKLSQSWCRGFTLIELLVVISIIGVLSSVVLASLNTARAKARDARRVSDVKQIATALFMVADKNNGTFPTPGSATCLSSGSSGTCYNASSIGGSDSLDSSIKEFLPSIPSDPSGRSGKGDKYVYVGPNRSVSYHCTGAPVDDIYGPIIVWTPEDSDVPLHGDSKCKNMGLTACCGSVGCTNGQFCFYKIQ